MPYRKILAALVLALCAGRLCAAVSFLPEVLILRTNISGTQTSFQHAALKTKTIVDKDGSVTFGYRAEADEVRCTVTPGTPTRDGGIPVTVATKRARTVQGNKTITNKTARFTLFLGKPLIVESDGRMAMDKSGNVVELLQLTLTPTA